MLAPGVTFHPWDCMALNEKPARGAHGGTPTAERPDLHLRGLDENRHRIEREATNGDG